MSHYGLRRQIVSEHTRTEQVLASATAATSDAQKQSINWTEGTQIVPDDNQFINSDIISSS